MKICKKELNKQLWEQGKLDELYEETIQFMKWKMRYAYKVGIPEDEIQGCMNMAFVKAVQRFVPEKGEFIDALSYCLQGEIRDYNRIRDKQYKDIVWYDSFTEEDADEGSSSMDYLETQSFYFTIDSPIEEEVCTNHTKDLVGKALATLTEKEKDITIRFYITGQSQSQIAEIYNTSQAQISRALKKSLSKLKSALSTEQPVEESKTESNKVLTSKESCYEAFSLGLDNNSTMERTGLAFGTVRKFRTQYNKEMGKEPTRGRKHKC